MKKLLVVIGKSGSGKTTLIAELIRRYPEQFKKVVTCTDRHPRIGEIDGVDYHFLPTKYFIDNPDLVLTKKTNDGFYYGTRKSNLFSNTHHLLLTSRLTGVAKLVSMGIRNVAIVNISISNELRIERMRQRGDTEESISNRLTEDAVSEHGTDFGRNPVINLDANQTFDQNVECLSWVR